MIDLHQHMLPPDYRRWLTRDGEVHDGFPVPHWSVESTLGAMEALRIDLAYLSISSPGIVDAKKADAPALARDVNAFGAAVTEAHPDRLRYFAALPMADPDLAMTEAVHALDNLKASGVGLLANTNGIYLGDPSQQGLLEVLEARHAVVFVHPTTLPGGPANGIPPFAADFLLDTTRAVIRLIASGTIANYPNIRFILPHAGGFVPYAATRIARTTASEGRNWTEIMAMLKTFYFDLAMSATETVLPSLLAFVGPEKICIGSDYPYAPAPAIAANFTSFASYPLDDADREMITRGTATQLFSRNSQSNQMPMGTTGEK